MYYTNKLKGKPLQMMGYKVTGSKRCKPQDINSKRVNSSGVPDGDYKVCIVNGGSKSITGAMQYEVK